MPNVSGFSKSVFGNFMKKTNAHLTNLCLKCLMYLKFFVINLHIVFENFTNNTNVNAHLTKL